MTDRKRRRLLTALANAGALFLAGCDRISQMPWASKTLGAAEALNEGIQHVVVPRRAMAQEFTEADRSPEFRSNGTSYPDSPVYRALAANGFHDYELEVTGLVERPIKLSLDELRRMPSRTQITRHDCVEGWSAIAKWKGVPLSNVLAKAVPKPEARFVVFRCADPMDDEDRTSYYESIDMEDAFHPQTILAYEMNDAALPIANGAPIRVRVERQLGYKMAKYVMSIELVKSFADIEGGAGGYWEDQGYTWYAGI